ncbi:MAG: ATP-binding protein [Thermoleophilia bacterium]|jgi:anti-sigma regulatory factor (Ser/Thr protein kinase)|nr:ATP-binding protein [Thermoleophilia bacterium]
MSEVVVEEELPRRREAAPRARAVVARVVAPDRESRRDLDLVVTELVANAVMHGRGRTLRLRVWADAVRARVEVENRRWTLRPRVRLRTATRPAGRGLLLVSAVADRWGVGPDTRGRARVWAEVALDRDGPGT